MFINSQDYILRFYKLYRNESLNPHIYEVTVQKQGLILILTINIKL